MRKRRLPPRPQGKRDLPLTPQQNWFIGNAAKIEKEATAKEIAGEIGLSPTSVGRIIREKGLRTRKQILDAERTVLRRRHFPAHEKMPKIIELLEETKIQKNRGFGGIAAICKVSPNFVKRVCERFNVLSSSEIRELNALFQGKGLRALNAKRAEKSSLARKLLQDPTLTQREIAKIVGMSVQHVSKVNKGRGKDGIIRDATKTFEIQFKRKPINHFSTSRKLELIEPWKKKIAGKLRAKNVPQAEWDRIIGSVTDALFRDLNYFDPKRGIPVDHFISALVKRCTRYYSRPRRQKTVSLQEFTTEKGEITIRDKKAIMPPEAASMSEILSKVGNLLSPMDKDILLKKAGGMINSAIGVQYGIGGEAVRLRIKKAMAKLARFFKEKNKQ